MAKIVHKGPYEECILTYENFFRGFQKMKKELLGLFVRYI